MGKLNKNDRGFTVVEILLSLIFVALILLIGLYVYHNHQTKTPTTTSSTTKSAKTVTSTSDASLISQRLQAIYTYANDDSASFNSGIFTNDYNYLNSQGYLSLSFYDKITANQMATASLIQCQGAGDNGISYGIPQVSANVTQATATVTERFTGMADSVISTSWVKTGTSWQLDNVTCPGQ
jgi:hypothetical protein